MGDDLDDTAIVWFRRDLRVHDQPIFDVAATRAKRSLAVFVLDETLLGPSGKARRTFLYRSLRDLDESLGGRLLVVRGDPAEVIPKLAGAVKAGSVHIAADFGPYGRERDEAVEKALGERDVELVRTGSPYAVAPGRVTKSDGEPYKVFTPFSRAWAEHGWRAPAETDASSVDWMDPGEKDGGPRAVKIPDDEAPDGRAARPRASARPASSGRRSSTSTSPTTTTCATVPTGRRRRGCRCT